MQLKIEFMRYWIGCLGLAWLQVWDLRGIKNVVREWLRLHRESAESKYLQNEHTSYFSNQQMQFRTRLEWAIVTGTGTDWNDLLFPSNISISQRLRE